MGRFAIVAAVLVVPALAAAQTRARKSGSEVGQLLLHRRKSGNSSAVRRECLPQTTGAVRRQVFVTSLHSPLDEIDSDIKRGDARCDRYEERQ